MPITTIGVNDPKAIKKYSSALAVDMPRKSYWNRKFMGGQNSGMPILTLTDLESSAGEFISYDLSMQLSGDTVEGDDRLDEAYGGPGDESLTFYTDGLYIDQTRKGVSAGGAMSRKRTLHELREVARRRQSDYWARLFDEDFFIYLSGARGSNNDFIKPTTYTGRANNPLNPPDADHRLYGGAATSTATITAADKLDLKLIDRAVTQADIMGGGTTGIPAINPIKVNGEDHYVLVMNSYQHYDLRTEVGDGKWLDLQKAAAAAEGRKNPIFQGGLGLYNNVVLHSHKSVIRFDHFGAGGDVEGARALFLGEQAGAVAWGSAGSNMRFDWHEEMLDRGNDLSVTCHAIFGIKKCVFNGKDFGMLSLDTAAKNPNTP